MIQRIHEITTGSKLVGIHGHAGVGKDTVCNHLHANYEGCWREAFADPLKKCAAAAFGISWESFNEHDLKEIVNETWGVSPRKIAQFLGTEMFRNTISGLICDSDSDFWIRRLTGTINGTLTCPINGDTLYYDECDTIVITDVRFQNEVDWIEANGGKLLFIHRHGMIGNVGITGHASEQDLKMAVPAWLIQNNGSLQELHNEVDKFAQHIGLIPRIKQKFDASNF